LLSAYLQGRRAAVELITPWVESDEVVTSILAYGEVVEYLKDHPNFSARHSQLLDLLNELVEPYFLSYEILERYADVRRQLRPPHGAGLIGDIDTLIAATALEHGLTVVTTDEDFHGVPGLQVMLIPRAALRAR
ncbi:MAG TPA: type II toxin-antitoxin system VapC family toxin, partial [Chloroflexota bacterium]|nr:type II toxin-antitoxin system VapC family toxin [Chloroflexota bacterium]